MATITVSEARAILPEIMDRVSAGEEVTLTRHGQPVAVIVRPDALRTRRADAAIEAAMDLHQLIHGGRRRPMRARSGVAAERADELVAEVRAGRVSR